jgi:hypothetical protein
MARRAGVDWLEAGTPLIIAEGMNGVRALRKEFPDVPIVADLKTMDGGWLEAQMMSTLRFAVRCSNCRPSAATICLPYSARPCAKRPMWIRVPICQYSSTNALLTL